MDSNLVIPAGNFRTLRDSAPTCAAAEPKYLQRAKYSFRALSVHLGTLALHDRVRATHVCRDWRQLALATPQLWTRLDIRRYCCASSDGPDRLYHIVSYAPGSGSTSRGSE